MIAITIVGIMLMIGRQTIRDGVRGVLACFVLLGAPIAPAIEGLLPPSP